jgi:hypothetical protein
VKFGPETVEILVLTPVALKDEMSSVRLTLYLPIACMAAMVSTVTGAPSRLSYVAPDGFDSAAAKAKHYVDVVRAAIVWCGLSYIILGAHWHYFALFRTVSHSLALFLLPFTTVYYRLLPFTTVYYRLLTVCYS